MVTSRSRPRIDPVADVDAGERGTQRLRHLTHGDAERPGEAAVDLDLELRLLTLGRQVHVHGAGDLAHLVRHLLRQPRQLAAPPVL